MSGRDFDPAVRPPNQIRKNKAYRSQDDAWVADYLKRAEICTVSSTWDDMPFNNVTLFWYDETHHRIVFHSNVMGRVRANIERNPKVCISCHDMGKLLPSNAAVEFSVQYRAVVVFGEARILSDPEEARTALYGLLAKYFPKMNPGVEYQPIQDDELQHTSVYSVEITSWSGKENSTEIADQIDSWEPLSDDILNGGFA
ncbi:MAG TPA: pyridoxamine 5'-phosphate oxidase family protein [Aggregatilineales bacterium]|nr:pyridoxamine 5'-phosphate oxidase family protein [Aggregatilineales bacterium]